MIVTLALGKFPLRTQGSLFDMMQAIATDPVPALSRKSFTPELCDFVDSMLQRNPADRPTARAMLRHPFLARYHNCRKLADLVNVPPATPPQVQEVQNENRSRRAEKTTYPRASCLPPASVQSKQEDMERRKAFILIPLFPLSARCWRRDRNNVYLPLQVRALLTKVVEYHMETDLRVRGSFPHNTGGDGEQWGGRPLVSRLYKSDVTVLAAQLQLTRTELCG